nr:hypothetical protein [Maribacter sp.]
MNFLLTEKIYVKGSKQHTFCKYLVISNLSKNKNSSVKWNFQKYLVN